MEKTVILFNGPPGSGKDTAASMAFNLVFQKYTRNSMIPWRPKHLKFADPLKAAAHTLYNIPHSAEYYEKELGHKWKNEPSPLFFGRKPRDVYISLSEEYAKRAHDSTFFGRIAARRIQLEKQANIFIFSDSGFADEAIPVIGNVGIENVLLVEMRRAGCSYDGDSRSYIAADLTKQFPKLKTQVIPNDQDKMLLRTLIHGTIIPWLDLDMEKA